MSALLVLLGAAGPTAIAAGLIAERLAPPTGPARTRPALDTCTGCDRPVPTGTTWCDWLCRNRDDVHDEHDYLEDRDA